MAHAERTVALDVPAARVWDLVGPFDALPKLHPAVRACELTREEGTGATLRRIHLHDGGLIVNRLEERDDGARFYRYTIVESPFPVRDYDCRLAVRERGPESCVVEWTSDFAPAGASEAEVVELFDEMMKEGLDRVKQALHG